MEQRFRENERLVPSNTSQLVTKFGFYLNPWVQHLCSLFALGLYSFLSSQARSSATSNNSVDKGYGMRWGFPGDTSDINSFPESERSPWGGRGNPLQYSCLENPMAREAWWAIVQRVTKSWTRLKQLSMHMLGMLLSSGRLVAFGETFYNFPYMNLIH